MWLCRALCIFPFRCVRAAHKVIQAKERILSFLQEALKPALEIFPEDDTFMCKKHIKGISQPRFHKIFTLSIHGARGFRYLAILKLFYFGKLLIEQEE